MPDRDPSKLPRFLYVHNRVHMRHELLEMDWANGKQRPLAWINDELIYQKSGSKFSMPTLFDAAKDHPGKLAALLRGPIEWPPEVSDA